MIYKEIDNKKKKWIVLIHCVCGNEKIFNNQISLLNKYYNVAIIRLAGHEIDSEIYEATFDYVVQELHNFVLNKRSKIDVLSVSLGAMIATKYISIYPNDVNNVYLIGNIYGFSLPILKVGYLTLTRINKLLPRRIYMYFITKLILPGKKQHFQRKKLYKYSLKMKAEFLYSWMREMGYFILEGKKYFDVTLSNKSNINLIYGENDNMFLKWVEKNIKGGDKSILHVVKGAGHLCNMDNPSIINTIIKEDNYETIGYN